LYHRRRNRLMELSGGEQQRVAIAIALANQPSLLLADEPTGSVDSKTARMIFDVFQQLNRDLNQTIIIVTHDRQFARLVNRVVAIRDGRTSSEFLLRQNYAAELAKLTALGLPVCDTDAAAERSHEELVVLDRSGRLQLPREYLDALGIQGRDMMRAELENGRIVLLPKESPASE
jgi:ABC-type methionine transport system ATPase subunit